MRLLAEARQRSVEFKDGGKILRGTLVTPEDKLYIDKVGLRKSLSSSDLLKVGTLMIDDKKLEEAAETSASIMNAVSDHSKFRPVKPYIKYTEGVNDEFGEAS